ncbi:hypothetical protein [Maritimibacter alexandrii]|uniref:hypothetical protein n=1 Tax=Maritimibacter alexandrii TaxID=2570355 RepID=UPI0011083417|nr:hypothetical protein [Maritimibacter alexandrii]
MPDPVLNASFDDDEVDRIASAVVQKVDRTTELAVELIMAAREQNTVAFDKAKADLEEVLGLGAEDA